MATLLNGSERQMGQMLFGGCFLALLLHPAGLHAQNMPAPSSLMPLSVAVDRVRVPFGILTDEEADSLRGRVVRELRTAGIEAIPTRDLFTNDPASSPVEGPTLLISLNWVPEYFMATIFVKEPVRIAGAAEHTTIIVYASRPYVYETSWSDHRPVLKYLVDDFVPAWRAQDKR